MRRRRLLLALAVGLAATVLMPPSPTGATHNGDTEVTVGSPDGIFSQNKQNEPTVAVNPLDPSVMVAGANENIDLEACAAGDPTTCPFTPGVGLSGIYFSLDGGDSWTQPTYTGWSARHCLGPAPCEPQVGPIGTVPWYFENRLVSNGDPVLAFGPVPGPDGSFSWDNGARLYYSSLTTNFSTERSERGFKGFAAITVARTDDIETAAQGGAAGKAAWLPPEIVSHRLSSTTFSDKEWIWADNAATSPHFGNAYVCWVSFRSVGFGFPEPVMISRSTDGGDTWSAPKQLTPAANPVVGLGRQGCQVATDSQGTVYVFWESAIPRGRTKQSAHFMARSFDGGRSFERGRPIATVVDVGEFDPNQGRLTFDGLAGARTNSFPAVTIANGAPTGENATDQIVMTWSDGRDGLNDEHALIQFSTDGGNTWSTPVEAEESGDRPDFPAVALSPDGEDLYLVYMAFLTPWQETTDDPREMEGVVRHAAIGGDGTPGGWTTLHRGEVGDARGSSANGLTSEFLGDYNFVVATNDFAAAVWNDVRDASNCEAIDEFRQALRTDSPLPAPPVQDVCPATFGNSDIWGVVVEPA